jgi:hypothetical protein
MLGDKLVDIPIYIFVAIWIAGLLLLLTLTLIRKLFPRLEQSIDFILLRSGKVILFTMKLSLLIVTILLIVWLIY